MSGSIARKGFLFQDLYLLFRVLTAASKSLDASWDAGASNPIEALGMSSCRFGLEASNSDTAIAKDWDVLVHEESRLEYAEVKSGAINKQDRLVYWERLRRELAGAANSGTFVVPILVVDPQELDSIDKWQGLANEAASFVPSFPLDAPSGNVLTSRDLLDEAMWALCRTDETKDKTNPSSEINIALDAMRRFELHCHKYRELDRQVFQFIEVLFPGGLTETQQNLLLGWLDRRATSSDEARRLFTIGEMLSEIGVLQDAISLAPGTLKTWRNLWVEVPSAVQARTRCCLGKHGVTVALERSQPIAVNPLVKATKSAVILGPGGAGKSVLLSQIAETLRSQGNEVFRCGADDIVLEELERLFGAMRFFAALAAIRRPESRLIVCIDGLDEADTALRKRWVQILARVAAYPNVLVVASVRDATWKGDGSVRRDLSQWEVISLDLWSKSLVEELLDQTPYRQLLPAGVIDLLRTPILLDLFWRTSVEVEAPDVSRAANLQTKHGIISAFWQERLVASQRHSKVSDIVSKIGEVVSRATGVVGAFSLSELDCAAVEILLSEGVLVHEGKLQHKLVFRHPMLRDFAFAQWCLRMCEAASVSQRWAAINGGLQQHGALRAIVEALSDPEAATEYPRLSLGDVVQSIVEANPSIANSVAYVLGAHEPKSEIDPGRWANSVQRSLPKTFGRELLIAARLNGNFSWARSLERWGDETSWLDKYFPAELLRWTEVLSGKAGNTMDASFLDDCRRVARKLQ